MKLFAAKRSAGSLPTLRAMSSDKLPAKAFLATEQRIPGLGNGVLQDILFHAGIHPKRKVGSLKDLFGNAGRYKTVLSKNTVGTPCPVCGSEIQKAAFMGGAVYWCPVCQRLNR